MILNIKGKVLYLELCKMRHLTLFSAVEMPLVRKIRTYACFTILFEYRLLHRSISLSAVT